jgi:DNA-binding NarL/FixJ family response regulator
LRSKFTPSQRQFMVLLMIADGSSNRGIAEELEINLTTVNHQVTALKKMFGAVNRANLVALAYQQGILVTK